MNAPRTQHKIYNKKPNSLMKSPEILLKTTLFNENIQQKKITKTFNTKLTKKVI